MKVLVTGASGYLGGRLCHALLRHGHAVRAFVRRSSDLSCLPAHSKGVALEIAYGDVTDYSSVLEACSGCQVVFHAAAIVDTWLPDTSIFFTVNVGGLKNVLRAYKETDTIEKIVYTSSIFALGSTDGYIADETQMHTSKYFCTEYEKSKTISDKIALDAAKEGVPIVSVYPGVVYGPGKITPGNVLARTMHTSKYFCTEYEKSKTISDKIALDAAKEGVPIVSVYPGVVYGPGKITPGNVLARTFVERFNGRLPGYLGDGNDRLSFTYVDDVVDGQISAMEKGQIGERYLLTGDNASINEAFDIASTITNTKRSWINIPLFVIELYGWLSVLFCLITGKLPLVTPPAVDILRHQWAYSCEKAKRELNYKPRSLTEGLEEVLPWLKKMGAVKY
ncbi:NAD-dependent epimerase/dehydratase [Artemisia annua]|uniref:NAD-dependent epimerase/dehydratase n=1 Tax=Artemisia annua TaxID=35608 RepID=A0A2U1NQW2_ARTAN|nr:NAD-dependent epimerase/dehydratase [Artemisia annua]